MAQEGRRRFPQVPAFAYLLAQIWLRGRSRSAYQASRLLEEAEQLAQRHLQGDEQQTLLQEIAELREQHNLFDPMRLLSFITGRMGMGPDENDDF
jgi:hypothetical protein